MADKLKFTSEGVPKNWKGKDWQAYKFAMQIVFREADLMEIVDGTITKETLSEAESEEKFDKKQTKIMRLIGMSVPSEILHQIRDKMTGTEMWEALCDLFENKVNKTVKAHTVRRLRDELWTVKFSPGGNMNLHLSKMFNIRTELQTLQYAVDDIDMVEMMLESLPAQAEFESLKSSIRYSADTTMFTPTKVRELIRPAAARQVEFRGKGLRGGLRGGNNGGASGVNLTKGRADYQHEEKSSDSKKKKLKKCFICGSTAHLRAACPDRADKSSGADANAGEQKRKPRGNVTIRQETRSPPSPDSDSDGSGVEMAALDQMILDAGVEVSIREPEPERPVDVDAQGVNGAEADGAVGDSNGWWFFDTAANAHVTGNLLDFVAFTEDTSQSQSVHGVAPALASRIAGVGTVALVTEVDGERGVVYLNDVVYVPGAEHGLFSPGLAAKQGFDCDYEHDTLNFRIKYEGRTVIVASPYEATWGFFVTHPMNVGLELPRDRTMCNFTAIDGVAPLALWHERLGHICPQYLKTMADKGMVKGLMLTRRDQQDPCDVCHLGKQKKTPRAKKLNRGLKAPNQAVYADLLIPSQGNGTRFEAVLVIMDGYSRFVTVHMLNSKSSEVINQHIKEYILWAERQAGRGKDGAGRVKYRVRQIWTDKGGEFVNSAKKKWYRAHGIEHVRVGPKSSQLNLCERTHQSLVGMMKAMMLDSGFPISLWPEALRNAVYLKNRVYNKGHGGVPYEMMFGAKPDVHHIRKFGALAYVHVPVTPGRRKFSDNAKVGFLLGYAEDVVGCKVYFPEEHTAKFVADLRVVEDVVYRDRHELVEDADMESLHFEHVPAADRDAGTGVDHTADDPVVSGDMESTMMASAGNESPDWWSRVLEGGEEASEPAARSEAAARTAVNDAVASAVAEEDESREASQFMASAAHITDIEGVTAAIPTEVEPGHAGLSSSQATTHHDPTASNEQQQEDAVSDGNESTSGVCGSVAASEQLDDIDEMEDQEEVDPIDETIEHEQSVVEDDRVTVASVCGSMMVDEHDECVQDIQSAHGDSGSAAVECVKQTGKRTHRDETKSEEQRVEQDADKQQPKRTRTGLREYHERRRPPYLNDYEVNVAQCSARVLDKDGKPILASNVKIPKNRRELNRSKYREFWLQADLEEMSALRAKGVIREIPCEEVPVDAKPISTRWVRSLKADRQGYVFRFKSRIVALGNYQRPGIDFSETFAPVARMSSFRMFVALAAVLHLLLYGGDINTAYLNALLGICQYLKSIEGFPCKINGHMYVVVKALYGLRQSGREWNMELNNWFLAHGYLRSLTEPCLYYKFEAESIMLVLVYVDDIMVATDNEEEKCKLFEELNVTYGIKDQGLLKEYLGIEVDQTDEGITIRQSKYAREVVQTFGYENAHAVGNPMETNVRLAPLNENDESDTSFDYRKAIGMLMFLATGTRPDLAFAVGQLSRFVASRFVAKPSARHVGTLKRVLWYLAGTVDYGISYERPSEVPSTIVLEGFCDSDWANDPESRKSTTGFVFSLAGGAVSWMSRRQSIVALSTAEVEYVAACEAAMEAVAASNILQEVLPQRSVKLKLGIDNQAAHVLATNPTYSRRTRHIELRWHFVREQVEKGTIDLHKVKGAENPADAFTKPLDKQRLKDLLWLVGVTGDK